MASSWDELNKAHGSSTPTKQSAGSSWDALNAQHTTPTPKPLSFSEKVLTNPVLKTVEKVVPTIQKGLNEGLGYLTGGILGASNAAVSLVGQTGIETVQALSGGKFDSKAILDSIVRNATKGFNDGKVFGEVAGNLLPSAFAAPAVASLVGPVAGALSSGALGTVMLSAIGANTVNDIKKATKETPKTSSFALNNAAVVNQSLKNIGSSGLQMFGFPEDIANKIAEVPEGTSLGLFLNGLIAYGAAKGLKGDFVRTLANSGGLVEGNQIRMTSKNFSSFLESKGMKVPPIPEGDVIVTALKPTAKGKITGALTKEIGPLNDIIQGSKNGKTKVAFSFEPNPSAPKFELPTGAQTKPNVVSANTIVPTKGVPITALRPFAATTNTPSIFYHGSNGTVEQRNIDLSDKKIITISGDQRVLTKSDSYPEADQKLIDLYGGQYDFVKIEHPEMPQKPVEFLDLSNGEWITADKATAEIYAMQSRGAKYDKGLEQAPTVSDKKNEADNIEQFTETFDEKVAKAAKDLNKKIVEQGLEELSENELAKYTPTKKTKAIESVSELLENNPENAVQMALGNQDVPNNIMPQVLFNAVARKALLEKNFTLLRELASSNIATERSLAAQQLGSAGYNNNSVVDTITEIQKEMNKKSPERNRKKVSKKLTEAKSKVNLSKEELNWDNFLDSIIC